MKLNGLPVFNIVLDPNDEEQGLSVVSIVDDPAVCQSLFCFSNEERKPMMFINEEKEQHCITSVAILADTPIYRIDASGEGYYVVFEKQTIRDLVEKYSKDNYNNLVSFQHNGEIVNDFIMLESYFVDKEKGINPTQFDVPDGSWLITYKCTNDEVWERVKNELSTGGYSIEILCDIEPAKEGQEIFDEPEPLYDEDEEFMNWLDELLKALDEAGCEVIMSNEKKKSVNDSEEDEDEDGLWSLNFDRVERTDVARLINKGVKINKVDYWVYGIGKDNGTDAAILYNPDNKKYVIMPLKDIKQFEPLKASVGEFPPLPDNIVDNENITVQKTIISNDIPSIMHSHTFAQLAYNDEQEPKHTGFRQVAIVAEGVTKAGNHCFRAFELFGDSRSAADGVLPLPSWRLFLTKRVQSLKAMSGTAPFTRKWLNGLMPDYNWNDDRSMEPCTDHITWDEFDN